MFIFYEQLSEFAPPKFCFSKLIFLEKKVNKHVILTLMNISAKYERPQIIRKGVPDLPHPASPLLAKFAPPCFISVNLDSTRQWTFNWKVAQGHGAFGWRSQLVSTNTEKLKLLLETSYLYHSQSFKNIIVKFCVDIFWAFFNITRKKLHLLPNIKCYFLPVQICPTNFPYGANPDSRKSIKYVLDLLFLSIFSVIQKKNCKKKSPSSLSRVCVKKCGANLDGHFQTPFSLRNIFFVK